MNKSIGLEMRNIAILLKRKIANIHECECDKTTSIHGWIIGYLFLNKDKEIFQKDIEEKFSMRKSTASKMLQLMEKNDLISRQSVGKDARLKKIILTEKSAKIFESIQAHIEKLEDKMKQNISEDELKIFFAVTEKIKQNLND